MSESTEPISETRAKLLKAEAELAAAEAARDAADTAAAAATTAAYENPSSTELVDAADAANTELVHARAAVRQAERLVAQAKKEFLDDVD